ncbi:MAG: ParB/RepB/Spo0J family partition protein [Clostridia bacterium]|nr:ParB/RepB/Spo0J family partition protein [Clostridia bacterium]
MAQKKMGLGKGLGALLSIYDTEIEEQAKAEGKPQPAQGSTTEIDINKVKPNPNQPRKNFNEEALNELAASIKTHGVIQPIIVNDNKDGEYLIIAGERRYRASKLLGLETIPCIVKNYTERQIKEISIIENLQREDLNPIEVAKSIKQLMEEYNFTQEVVADRIGISRPNIANTPRLLSLCPEVIKMVEENKLSAGHARCLVVINDANVQIKFAKAACDNKMTVRDLEKAVKMFLTPKESKNNTPPQQSSELKELINEMQRVFSTKVSAIGSDKKGRIYIDYYSRDDLDRICELIELLKTKKLTLKDLSEFNKRNSLN